MPSLRHRIRTIALQALFELDATDHAPDEIVTRWLEDELLPPEGARFLRQLVFGVWEHYSYLDRIIEEAAPSWPVNQMPGVDKAILRIALYEILIDEAEKTPVKAVINEAVELAKQFGSDNSSRFVNGVLGTVVTRYIEGYSE
jgi:N utilization substance protein B